MDLGESGLGEEDQYLLEVNGAQQEYWLRAIVAARMAKQLRADGQR